MAAGMARGGYLGSITISSTMDFDTTVRLAIQEAFIAGRPTPTVESIASDLHGDVAAVAAAFDRLADGHVIVLAPGTRTILMSAPFAGRATDFAAVLGARTYDANCIWDALGIVAMFAGAGRGTDAVVRTRCADCGDALSVVIGNGSVTGRPPGAVAHFAVPASHWWDDIGFT